MSYIFISLSSHSGFLPKNYFVEKSQIKLLVFTENQLCNKQYTTSQNLFFHCLHEQKTAAFLNVVSLLSFIVIKLLGNIVRWAKCRRKTFFLA